MIATSIAAPATPIAPVPIAQEAQLAPQMQESRAIAFAPTLKAQFARSLSGGGIQGTITDPSGAAVAKATVTATNTDTGVATTHITSGTGTYSIQPLQVGTYNVEVTAKGFQRLLQENINVANNSVIGLNLKPSVGGENTTITVTDAPPYINTTDAVLGGTIENNLYASLPLSMNGGPRDPTAFQYLMPGVQENPGNNTNQGTTAGVSGIYGTGQTNLNANYVEGVPVSNISAQGDGTAVATAVSTGASAAGLTSMKRLPTLPSKLPALAVVEKASRTLALDTAGALFRSDDAGVTWIPVPPQWQGRALTLRLSQPPSATQPASGMNAASAAAARPQPQALASPVPVFELTTGSGAIYTSSDGQTWQRK
ncbi:MAG: carboxypeptidase-like regulatory domain-containing protein [Bryobacteraceae bacterium]